MTPQDPGKNVVEWFVGQTLLDDYVVERVLGEGGMGKVYLLKSQITKMEFAVKRVKGLSDADRQEFFAELNTWIDLPGHPNLLPCRFFRTVDGEVLIFAEFVDGGSLKDWIDSGKLYEGGKSTALARILDTATQFAWGLHCLHELGLVHQDVKPANVMMGNDTQVAGQGPKAMVADFGLARVRTVTKPLPRETFKYIRAGTGVMKIGIPPRRAEVGQSILVSSGGYTPTHCSPEQVSGERVDRRTDIWSWGLCVLEMFQGGVTWHSGAVAAEALDAFLEHNGDEDHIPAMPVELANALKNCFHQEPVRRYQTMSVLTNWLPDLYSAITGREYPRTLNKIEERNSSQDELGERRTQDGVSWEDPVVWLKKALNEENRNAEEAKDIIARNKVSRRGRLVADIIVYDEARRAFERLVNIGRIDLENDLAQVCGNEAILHAEAGNILGAIALHNQAIEIRERLATLPNNTELAESLAMLYMNKAVALKTSGDNQAAVTLYNQAISIKERLVNIENRSELANGLVDLYMKKADALVSMRERTAAVALYDRAIVICERLFNREKRKSLGLDLATLYINKANALSCVREKPAVTVLHEQAAKHLEEIPNIERNAQWANVLASLCLSRANVTAGTCSSGTAIPLFDQGIKLLEHLVKAEGRGEFSHRLAILYHSKGIELWLANEYEAAVKSYDCAINIREHLVILEGRVEFANDLTWLYEDQALVLDDLQKSEDAASFLVRAIELQERLFNVKRQFGLNDKLVHLYMTLARIVPELEGGQRASLPIYDRAISMITIMILENNHVDLRIGLSELYKSKAGTYTGLEDYAAAVDALNEAKTVLNQIVIVDGKNELTGSLCNVYSELAEISTQLGDIKSAEFHLRKSSEIWNRSENKQNRIQSDLRTARYRCEKAETAESKGDKKTAADLYATAIEVYERLIYVEGVNKSTERLASLKRKQSLLLQDLGENPGAAKC